MNDVKFSYNGKYVASCSSDGTARIYDVVTGMCGKVLIGHESEILKVCLSL